MRDFRVGDCVLVINAACVSGLIGHVGTVARAADQVSGIDRFGRVVAGAYVVVDLPDDVNRHGTTLWYLKPEYLIKLAPPEDPRADKEWIPDNACGVSGTTSKAMSPVSRIAGSLEEG